MAKFFENDKKFVIIEAPASEFVKIGLGANGVIYCDNTMKVIEPEEICYYVAVLNEIFCKNELDKFLNRATRYLEDSAIENRNAKNMYKWLHLGGFWDRTPNYQ